MKIEWPSGLSDQNLVTNPQCYKDRQNRSSLLSVSMRIPVGYRLCFGTVRLFLRAFIKEFLAILVLQLFAINRCCCNQLITIKFCKTPSLLLIFKFKIKNVCAKNNLK